MKKFISIALVLALMISVFAACGKESPPAPETPAAPAGEAPATPAGEAPATEPSSEGTVGGKIVFSSWDIEVQDPYLLDVIRAFNEKHPDVEVQVNDIPSADYDEKLNVDLNGGAAADVFFIKKASETPFYAQKGQLEDLTPYIEKAGVDLSGFNGLEKNLLIDGKQVGIPFRTDYYILFYNKDIFDDAETDYPSNDMTWDEFAETAALLSSGEGPSRKYGGYIHTWQALVQNMAIQSGEHTIMGPEYAFFKPAYELVLGMQTNRSIQDYATLKTGNIHYSGPFQQGNVAMLPMGTWYMSTMIEKVNAGETEVNWGIATLPHPDGVEAGYVPGSMTPVAMNAASENKEAAWAFIEFLTSEEGAAMLAKVGKLPGRVNDTMLGSITAMEGMPEGAKEALAVKNISLDRPIVENVSEVDQVLGEVHGLIMLEEKTIDEGIAEIEQRSKEIQGIS